MAVEYGDFVKRLDTIRRISPKGTEYWRARELQGVLGYANWQNFTNAIERAKLTCKNAEIEVSDHFAGTSKMVSIGSGAERETEDYYLTRGACYLVAMNGDSGKPEVAFAQTYFAAQTHKMERFEQAVRDYQRIELRKRVSRANLELNGAAKRVGVKKFGLFYDARYRGLYGMGLADVKRRKKLSPSDELLDHAGRKELSAHEFTAILTEEALGNVQTERVAIETHRQVASEVRGTIQRSNGVMPENLPAEKIPVQKLPGWKEIEPPARESSEQARVRLTSANHDQTSPDQE